MRFNPHPRSYKGATGRYGFNPTLVGRRVRRVLMWGGFNVMVFQSSPSLPEPSLDVWFG